MRPEQFVMKKDSIKAELLAPAGSLESLKAAVINGADAVYLGLGSFSARALAQNFSIETLQSAVDYAHIFGVKVYLTINTLLKNSEVDEAVSLAKKAWNCGVSAVIVQDLGFAQKLKKEHPEIVLHASTQMGVHNLYGALAAQKLGMERVILSRETPLSEIKTIADNCPVELEYFVHGALCCGFSGNCYFSSLICGKSGNRGRCLQLCRKSYLMQDKNKGEYGYLLSTRDTMLAGDLKRLYGAGVRSFKIEGRMKRPEYVGEVTRIYRKALDGMIGNDDISNLKLMFNRGDFSKAHIDGANSGIIYSELQSHMGIKLGNVKSVFKNKAVLDCAVSKGDGIKFLRNSCEAGHALVLHDGFETGFVGKVQAGDGVYLTDSAKKNIEINSRSRKLPIKISARFSLMKNSCAVVLVSGENSKEFVYSVDLQPPQKSPVSSDDIRECLTSLGGTYFECEAFDVQTDSSFFATKAVLKGLRRQFINDFEQHIISSFNRPCAKNDNLYDIFEELQSLDAPENCTIVMCCVQDAKIYENFADYIAIKPDNYAQLLNDIKSGKFTGEKNKYMLDLPVVSFSGDLKLLQEIVQTDAFDKYIVNNIYGLSFVSKRKILLGYKTNMLNSLVNFSKVVSIEGSLRDKAVDGEFVYMFGRPDLMQSVHCYYKLKRGCDKCGDKEPLMLTDDKGESYAIKKQKIHNCYNLLVSCMPVNVGGKSFKKRFFDTTNLTQDEKESLLDFLKGANEKINTDKYFAEKKLD